MRSRPILRLFFLVGLTLLHIVIGESHSDIEYTPLRTYTGQTIWDLPSIPEEQIDVGLWALVVAKEYDDTVNVEKYLQTLDTMAREITRMVGPRDIDMVKLVMTKMYLYDTGVWNGGYTFKYDLDDPLGQKPGAQLLTTYLDTHKGNCVSMPTLFIALMERVDHTVPFYGVSAPLHLFCRLRDRQRSRDWNVETTNDGHNMRDEWVIEQNNVPRIAIDSGSYMGNLSKKEFIAEIIGTLVYRFRHARDYEKALSYAELMLKLNPKSLIGLVQKGALLAWLGHTMKVKILAENRRPNSSEESKLKLYYDQSELYIDRARSLGREPETPESREKYLELIKRTKDQMTQGGENNE